MSNSTKILFILVVLSMAFLGCKKTPQFEIKANQATQNDGAIDASEWEEIVALVEADKSKAARLLLDGEGKVIEDKLMDYLISVLAAKEGISLDEDDFKLESSTEKYDVHFFFEASGSMIPYLDGNTEFKRIISKLISNIVLSDKVDEFVFSYINDTSKIGPVYHNNKDIDVLTEYVSTITPERFEEEATKINARNFQTTILTDIILRVLEDFGPNEMCIVVSDFVLSFDNSSSYSTEDQFRSQGQKIKNYLNNITREMSDELAIQFFRLESIYSQSGDYNYDDINEHKFDIPPGGILRPFYILVLSTKDQLDVLDKEILSISNIARREGISGFRSLVFYNDKSRSLFKDIKVKNSRSFSGSYNPVRGKEGSDQLIIEDVQFSDDDTFEVGLSIVLRDTLFPLSYLNDPHNYELEGCKSCKLDISDDASVYKLTLYEKFINELDITIKLKATIPSWVSEFDITDDSNFYNNIEDRKKTLGLRYLVEGLYEGVYNPKPSEDYLIIDEIKVTLKR